MPAVFRDHCHIENTLLKIDGCLLPHCHIIKTVHIFLGCNGVVCWLACNSWCRFFSREKPLKLFCFKNQSVLPALKHQGKVSETKTEMCTKSEDFDHRWHFDKVFNFTTGVCDQGTSTETKRPRILSLRQTSGGDLVSNRRLGWHWCQPLHFRPPGTALFLNYWNSSCL